MQPFTFPLEVQEARRTPMNEELRDARKSQLKALGAVTDIMDDYNAECIGAMVDGQFVHWDFVDELPLYSDDHWVKRVSEYVGAIIKSLG